MDPLNKNERTGAFLKMLALFLLTLILAAIPMFYAFRFPIEERKYRNSQNENLETQINERNKENIEFLLLADSARSLFDQYSNEKVDLTKGRISSRFSSVLNRMEDFTTQIEKDSVRSNLFGHLVDTFNDLFAKVDDVNKLQLELKETAAAGAAAGAGAEPEAKLTDKEKLIEVINNALKKHNGNKKDAAKELGMTERKLKNKMEDLGM